MVKDFYFRNLSDNIPVKDGRYLVVDSDGRVNIATWSVAEHAFVGWDVLANEPIGDVKWYADVYEEGEWNV